jgi:hypothetical protein
MTSLVRNPTRAGGGRTWRYMPTFCA